MMNWGMIWIWAFLSFGTPFARAADFHSPRTASLGGAGHAGPLLTDAIFLNPAFISFLPTYALSFAWTRFSGAITSADNNLIGRNYSVSVQDGRSDLFQAGVAYTVREDQRFLHFSASKAVIKLLGFGIGAKASVNYGADDVRVYEGIASIAAIPFSFLNLSFIVDNILGSKAAERRQMYREYILGAKANIGGLIMIYADPHFIPHYEGSDKFGYQMGIELTGLGDVYFRGGYYQNSRTPWYGEPLTNGFGLGVGWTGPKISLEYGFQRVSEPRLATSQNFGVTIYF